MRRLSLGNGEKVLLLTFLRKRIERIQGTTLLSVIGKVFCKVLKNGLVDKEVVLHEGQAANVYSKNEIVQGKGGCGV